MNKIKKYDIDGYNDILKDAYEMDLIEYAMNMHNDLYSATMLLKGNRSNYKISDVNGLLVKYPSRYSWALVVYEILKNELDELEENFENQKKIWYKEIEENIESKATVKTIESIMYNNKKVDIDKINKEIRHLSSKVSIANGIVKVWSSSNGVLQSLSKNLVAELDMSKMRLK